jgi:hypothetical protein
MECIFSIIYALQSMFIMIMHPCNFLKFYEFINVPKMCEDLRDDNKSTFVHNAMILHQYELYIMHFLTTHESRSWKLCKDTKH